jgi:hypothetical protein
MLLKYKKTGINPHILAVGKKVMVLNLIYSTAPEPRPLEK